MKSENTEYYTNNRKDESVFQEGESFSSELTIQANINFNGSNNYIEIPADGEWHSISYYDENIIFDNIEVYNRVLSEDEISSAFSVFGDYADRVLSKEELEIIHSLLNDHSEIKSWQIKNNILYLEIDDEYENRSYNSIGFGRFCEAHRNFRRRQ